MLVPVGSFCVNSSSISSVNLYINSIAKCILSSALCENNIPWIASCTLARCIRILHYDCFSSTCQRHDCVYLLMCISSVWCWCAGMVCVVTLHCLNPVCSLQPHPSNVPPAVVRRLDSISEQLAEQATSIIALSTRSDTLEGQLTAAITNNQTTTQQQLTETQQQLTETQQQLATAITNNQTTTQQQLTATQQQLAAAITNNQATTQQRLTATQQQLAAAITNNQASTQQQLAATQQEVSTLRNEQTTTRCQVQALTDRLNGTNDRLDHQTTTLTDQLSDTNQRLHQQTTTLTQTSLQISSLRDQVSCVSDQLSRLSASTHQVSVYSRKKTASSSISD